MTRYWLLLVASAAVAIGGCASDKPTTRPSGVKERADAAMRDPMSYEKDNEWPSISGGGISDFDKKAFDRDVDHVLNP